MCGSPPGLVSAADLPGQWPAASRWADRKRHGAALPADTVCDHDDDEM
eukprot:gene18003-16136_t